MSFCCETCGVSFDRPNKLEIHKATNKHLSKEHDSLDRNELLKEMKRIKQEADYKLRETQNDLKKAQQNLKKTQQSLKISEKNLSTTEKNLKASEKNLVKSQKNLNTSEKEKSLMAAKMKDMEAREETRQNSISTQNNIGRDYNDNRTMINIHVNNHGNENWEYLSQSKLYQLMKGVNTFLPELVKLLHFDKNHPENHNIKFKNQRLKQMLVVQGNKWEMVDKDCAIDNLVRSIIDKVECDDELRAYYESNSTSADKRRWDELKKYIGYEEASIDKKREKSMKKKVADTIVQEQQQLSLPSRGQGQT